MKKYLKLLILILMALFSCKSRKIDSKEEKRTEIEKQETKTEKQEVSGSLTNHFESNHFENEILNYDFSLTGTNENKPAIITEYRNGKPYRSIVAQNATYSEKKQQKKEDTQEVTKDYSADFSALKTAFESQNTTIVQLQKKVETLKVDNLKIASTLKYLAISFILFLVIWIAERSGLFVMLKRFFNGL